MLPRVVLSGCVLLFAALFGNALAATEAGAAGSARAQVFDSIATLRGEWVPQLRSQMDALQSESADALNAVDGGETVARMVQALDRVEESLAAVDRDLRAPELDFAPVARGADTAGREGAMFGKLLEVMLGGDPRFEALRVDDAAARKRLLEMAPVFRGFSRELSRFLEQLPDAVEEHTRR